MLRTLTLLAALAASGPGWSFDAHGFESGMGPDDVLRLAAQRYAQVENARDFLIATQPRGEGEAEQMQFWFCRERLVMVAARPRAGLDLRDVMVALSDQILARGQPLRIDVRPGHHGGLGESRELALVWKTQPGYFAVMINHYEKAEGHVSHMWFAENACMRPYWLREIEGGSDEARMAPTLPEGRT